MFLNFVLHCLHCPKSRAVEWRPESDTVWEFRNGLFVLPGHRIRAPCEAFAI